MGSTGTAGAGVARRNLIEVSLPLEAINAEAAREKSIRHGHPYTPQLWWARRPLAAARAVLVLPGDPVDPVPTDDWLLVKPETAQPQREAEETNRPTAPVGPTTAGEQGSGTPPTGASGTSTGGTSTGDGPAVGPTAPVGPTTPPPPTRFFGVYKVSADRYARDFARIGCEILPHLSASGVELEITIELQAANPTGFDPDTVRTVTENATTLKIRSIQFRAALENDYERSSASRNSRFRSSR
jgi:hypothetical protein